MKLLASVFMLGINFRRLANTRFKRIIVICIKYSLLKGTLLIEDMHAILFERKMISGAVLPKKVDGERLSKIYENSI